MMVQQSEKKTEIDEKEKKIAQTHQKIEKTKVDMKKNEDDIEMAEEAASGNNGKIESLLSNFPWLANDTSHRMTQFAQTATQETVNIGELKKHVEELMADVKLQEKTINKRVVGTLDDSITRHKELMEKR